MFAHFNYNPEDHLFTNMSDPGNDQRLYRLRRVKIAANFMTRQQQTPTADNAAAVIQLLIASGYDMSNHSTAAQLQNWKDEGQGRHVTLWVRNDGGNFFLQIDGRFFRTHVNNFNGPGLTESHNYDLSQYRPRHPGNL